MKRLKLDAKYDTLHIGTNNISGLPIDIELLSDDGLTVHESFTYGLLEGSFYKSKVFYFKDTCFQEEWYYKNNELKKIIYYILIDSVYTDSIYSETFKRLDKVKIKK